MPYHRTFRAVSLDLWYTTLYPGPGDERRWNDSRIHVLETCVEASNGARFDRRQVEAALKESRLSFETDGRPLETIDPQSFVTATVERLGGRWTTTPEAAGEAYSAAGLDTHPPRINPEATALSKRLASLGIPVISITNTARREASWRDFFAARRGPRFDHIVASCEVGRIKPDREIFLSAADRLHLPLSEVLHIGDRWDLDVEGARGSGMGAVLYRGLWSLYPEGLYPDVRDISETSAEALDFAEVPRVDRLDDLLAIEGFSWKRVDSSRPPESVGAAG